MNSGKFLIAGRDEARIPGLHGGIASCCGDIAFRPAGDRDATIVSATSEHFPEGPEDQWLRVAIIATLMDYDRIAVEFHGVDAVPDSDTFSPVSVRDYRTPARERQLREAAILPMEY
jgi:hypothetical protein